MQSALFLDRDGVVNVEKNYVCSIREFEFIDGIFELCRSAKKSNLLIIIVTNQAGIGRGFYTEDQFEELTCWMRGVFVNEGAPISAVYHCPYHPEHGLGKYRKDSYDRKPNPGMFIRAREDFGLSLQKSIMIGDKETDIQAANAAGITNTFMFGRHSVSTSASTIVSSLEEARRVIFGI